MFIVCCEIYAVYLVKVWLSPRLWELFILNTFDRLNREKNCLNSLVVFHLRTGNGQLHTLQQTLAIYLTHSIPHSSEYIRHNILTS